MSEKVLCARCGKKCAGKYVYMSAIDTNLICQDCWDKEQPKELIKRMAELEEKNKKLTEQLKTKDTINNLYKNTLELRDSDFIDLVYENAKLKQENAKLQEQLKNSIVLPIKVGQSLYHAYYSIGDNKCIISKGKVTSIEIWFESLYNDGITIHQLRDFNTFVFATEAEAQKYLEEIK